MARILPRKPLNILLIEDDEDDAFYIKDLISEGLENPVPKSTTILPSQAISKISTPSNTIWLCWIIDWEK